MKLKLFLGGRRVGDTKVVMARFLYLDHRAARLRHFFVSDARSTDRFGWTIRRPAMRLLMAMAAAALMGCAPSAGQIAQTRSEQQWSTYFRKARQECLDRVLGACARFENALEAQRAYSLYYNSKTIPGVSTPAFTPVTVPIAVGLPRFSGGMGGFRRQPRCQPASRVTRAGSKARERPTEAALRLAVRA
jgi:hypothetical protein